MKWLVLLICLFSTVSAFSCNSSKAVRDTIEVLNKKFEKKSNDSGYELLAKNISGAYVDEEYYGSRFALIVLTFHITFNGHPFNEGRLYTGVWKLDKDTCVVDASGNTIMGGAVSPFIEY